MGSEAQVGFTNPPSVRLEERSITILVTEDDVISGRKIAWGEAEGRE
jgi:hypothetical protein